MMNVEIFALEREVEKLLFDYKFKGFVLYFNAMHFRNKLGDYISPVVAEIIEVFMFQKFDYRKENEHTFVGDEFIITMRVGTYFDIEIYITDIASKDKRQEHEERIIQQDLLRLLRYKRVSNRGVNYQFFGNNTTSERRHSDGSEDDFALLIEHFKKYSERCKGGLYDSEVIRVEKTIGDFTINYNSKIYEGNNYYDIKIKYNK